MKAWLFIALAACSTSKKGIDASPFGTGGEMPINNPGQPGVGGHGLAYYGLETNFATSISTPAFTTQASGSTLVVSVGRGKVSATAVPTDNKNNTYQQVGATHTYTRYTTSGTAVYAIAGATGGDGTVVSVTNAAQDEITIAAVEVTGATHIQDQQWNEQLQAPLQSKSVTTTGPATLVAFWWGDAPEPMMKTAVPNNGFTVVDSILNSGALVQCAVAVKNVAAAGTYDVTWTSTPAQGAQLWLIAVQ